MHFHAGGRPGASFGMDDMGGFGGMGGMGGLGGLFQDPELLQSLQVSYCLLPYLKLVSNQAKDV